MGAATKCLDCDARWWANWPTRCMDCQSMNYDVDTDVDHCCICDHPIQGGDLCEECFEKTDHPPEETKPVLGV